MTATFRAFLTGNNYVAGTNLNTIPVKQAMQRCQRHTPPHTQTHKQAKSYIFNKRLQLLLNTALLRSELPHRQHRVPLCQQVRSTASDGLVDRLDPRRHGKKKTVNTAKWISNNKRHLVLDLLLQNLCTELSKSSPRLGTGALFTIALKVSFWAIVHIIEPQITLS